MNYETMLEIAQNRRSIRRFTDQPVSREEIEKIVNLGMIAPSGANWQPWEIVVVDEQALKDEISQYLLDGIGDGKTAKGFVGAAAFIILYGDTRIQKFVPESKRGDDAWWEFTFNASLNNAFMSMQYAVSSLGLGSMWVSAFRNPKVDEPTKKLLGIPGHLRAYEMMAIGYPDLRTGKKKMRDISNVLHYNKADNYRKMEDLDASYRIKK